MNLIEAFKTRKKFRRKDQKNDQWYTPFPLANYYQFSATDLEANDWEIWDENLTLDARVALLEVKVFGESKSK